MLYKMAITIFCFLLTGVLLYLFWRFRFGTPPDDIPAVLAYHKVTNFEFGGTWVSPSRFISQIDHLLDNGFKFISEKEYLEVIEGKRVGSSNELLLTFDDGYRSLMDKALPFLAEKKIPATIFLITSFAGSVSSWELPLPGRRVKHMDWGEAKELLSMGFSIGSHSMTHRDLTALSDGELWQEVAGSKKEIEDRVGVGVLSFSYPFGRSSERVVDFVRSAGYGMAFSMYPAQKNSAFDRFNIRRNGVYVIDTSYTVLTKVSRGRLFWVEDLKGRVINSFAILTPLLRGDR